MITIPRAPSGTANVIIDAGVWDDVATALERLQKITVYPPLQMLDTPAGVAISIEIPDGIRWVLLLQNGGVAGSDVADCTFTYDLYDFNDTGHVTKLNTAAVVSPKGPPRDPKVAYTAASEGLAQQDATGAWHLLTIDEAASTADCAA